MVSFTICEGNPGALTFLMDAYMNGDECEAERAFQRMEDNGIRGYKLYMLWNDCCSRCTSQTVRIMLTHTIEDIMHHINCEEGRGIPYEDDEAEEGEA